MCVCGVYLDLAKLWTLRFLMGRVFFVVVLLLKETGSDIDRGRSKVAVDVKPVARILCPPTIKL
jgi:hypothetical protein